MADYNIYIRTVGGEGGGNPVKPFQTGGGDGNGGAFQSAGQLIGTAGSVAADPDSAIGAVGNVGVGAISKAVPWLGAVIAIASIVIGTTAKVVDSVMEKRNAYTSSASGDYSQKMKYNNVKQMIHIVTHPYSTAWAYQQQVQQARIANQKNAQEMLLTGGTILNSPYGRYL